MTEDELLSLWAQEKPMYEAWGDFVSAEIVGWIKTMGKVDPELFLKLPPKPRLKVDDSLVEKALYRGKKYRDPYNDISDKVGTRFVVLTTRDMKLVREAVEQHTSWSSSLDRDFELEIQNDPTVFDYSATHYVVRNRAAQNLNGIEVAPNVACEVQIKTILQHAYSELTHDSIYKPRIVATSMMQRSAAKSSALIEATNDYFVSVMDQLEGLLQTDKQTTESTTDMYRELIGRQPSPTALEGLLVKSLLPLMDENWSSELRAFLLERPRLIETVQRLSRTNLLYRQPSVLLIFYLVERKDESIRQHWPLTLDELRPFFTSLGKRLSESAL